MKDFGGGAVNESMIFWIMNNFPAGSVIIELGSGSGTTKHLAEYKLYSVEQDSLYLHRYQSEYIFAPLMPYDGKLWYDNQIIKDNIPKDFKLLIIDGPIGDNRVNIIDFFVELFSSVETIIIDDYNRPGEKRIFDFLLTQGYKLFFEGPKDEDKEWIVLTK
jgi:hypothetical protein